MASAPGKALYAGPTITIALEVCFPLSLWKWVILFSWWLETF